MTKTKQKLLSKFIFVAGLMFFINSLPIPAYVDAQSQDAQFLEVQGLAVTPFLIETDVEAGVAQRHSVTIANTTDQPLPIDVSINDFIPDESGQAKFLATDATSNPAYSLSSWIDIVQQPSFTIPPREQTVLIFSITAPQEAVPGTHYGGLLFSTHPQAQTLAGAEVTQKVGVIIIARFGHGRESGNITQMLPEQGSDSFKFLLSFYNDGNVHLKPKGDINITDIFGNQVGSVPVNPDAQIVLPDNQKIFESSWKPGWRFGRYKATAILYFGNPKLEARANVVIWIIPIKQIAILLAVLSILGYLLVRGLRRYNRYILKEARRSEISKKR
jgi:hypothetical protein